MGEGHAGPKKKIADSLKEYKRYLALKMESARGAIQGLRMQVSFPLAINGVLICRYIADFVYVRNGVRIVEDCKGFKTPEYKLKFKMMEAIHGITILES